MYDRRVSAIRGMTGEIPHTMLPLLSRAPLAQNVLVTRSRGVTVLVARFQSAPHAEWLLICSGSLAARSKKRTRLGETTMDSSATIPEVCFFRSNLQPGADGAALDKVARRGRSDNDDNLMVTTAR